MSKWDNPRSFASGTGACGPYMATAPSRLSEDEEWAWMVDEDPAFYLEESAPDKRDG